MLLFRYYANLHFIKSAYTGVDLQLSIVEKYRVGNNLPGFENVVEKYFKEDNSYDLASTFINNKQHYDVSRRLRSMSEAEYKEVFNTLLSKDMKPYLEYGLEKPAVMAAVISEVSTNLFYRKSRMGQYFSANEKVLNIRDFVDNLKRSLNT